MPYINKENTLKAINKLKSAGVFSEAMKTAAIKTIENQPTADVVKVKHGEWLSNAQTDEYVCSECSGIAPVDCEKEDFYESNYCPNCGAKMDLKEVAEK